MQTDGGGEEIPNGNRRYNLWIPWHRGHLHKRRPTKSNKRPEVEHAGRAPTEDLVDVGSAISSTAKEKDERVSTSRPTVNMWWAQTK